MNAKITLFVAPDGCDANDGSLEKPYKTLSAAQNASREAVKNAKSVEIEVQTGEYRENLVFTSDDSSIKWNGKNAIISGGVKIPYRETDLPEPEILSRFEPEAAAHIRMIDLSALGAEKETYERMYAIGGSTASKYDSYKDGINIEVFEDGRRMTCARYPNNGYLKLDSVIDVGEAGEFPTYNYWYDVWNDQRNPRAGTYVIDKETNERVKNWKNPDTAWMFGYFFWDWADHSTPVTKVDTTHRAVYTSFVSRYGSRAGAQYYFYNVLEELDSPGEYFIDRTNGRLYVYADSCESEFEVSLSEKPLISFDGAEDMTVSGFTLTNTRETAVTGTGNRNTLDRLIIKNVAGHGVSLTGNNNKVQRCDISHTARGGIILTGGDRKTLTHGENIASNNFIHDYSEVYQTHQPGITLAGVGNICSHNEICNAPHDAINYTGNEHLIEYNYVHHVERHSKDAGAIYSGRDWAAHGTVLRYNIVRDLGSEEFKPSGIYWDDVLSGQTAYGNIIINAGGMGFLVGGGRDHRLFNNIVVGECDYPLYYDSRDRDCFVNRYGSYTSCDTLEGCDWVNLFSVPFRSEIWAKKYPNLAKISDNFDDYDNPDFPINPAYSTVENNIVINANLKLGYIADSVYTYSKVSENPIYKTPDDADFNLETLKFNHPRQGFPEIPVDEIGIVDR